MSDKTIKHARELRRNQTNAEKLLWSKIRNRQFENLKFRRQHPIPPYIVDFFCEDLKLVIELDGGQHTEKKDQERQSYIEKQGYEVIRFWNNDVLNNIDGLLETLKTQPPSPKPSPQGEGLICLGKIAAPHGVKGLVKILAYGEDPALIKNVREHTITLKNRMGKYILAEIEGCDSREAAEALKGTELCINKSDLPDIDEEDTYYYADLIGMACADESGEETGIVKAVHNFGAGDMLEIQPSTGGHTFLLPFTNETILEVKSTITLSEEAKRFIGIND